MVHWPGCSYAFGGHPTTHLTTHNDVPQDHKYAAPLDVGRLVASIIAQPQVRSTPVPTALDSIRYTPPGGRRALVAGLMPIHIARR
jgi:hypothetical protein